MNRISPPPLPLYGPPLPERCYRGCPSLAVCRAGCPTLAMCAALRPAAPPAAEQPRAVVTDDGNEMRLTVYRGADTLAETALDTADLVRLAGEMIAAVSRRLNRGN
jgi:hypothetical protein